MNARLNNLFLPSKVFSGAANLALFMLLYNYLGDKNLFAILYLFKFIGDHIVHHTANLPTTSANRSGVIIGLIIIMKIIIW